MVDMIATEYEAKCSALSVVVNELDGGVKAHHGDECMQGKHLPPRTTFLKASYHQSPEHIQIPLHIRGDGVGRFTQMKNPALGWDS